MGAWPHFRVRFGQALCGHPFDGIGRPPAASPATGSAAAHKLEQQRLVARAFGIADTAVSAPLGAGSLEVAERTKT